MACPSCGADNPTTSKFCGQCGSSLPRAYAACGQANPPSNRFCGECGATLQPASTATGTPIVESAAGTVQQRTPRHLAEQILANRAALEGERKQVTVLFADIVGSTELIRDRDPEEAQALLDGAVKLMMDAVHRYEGTVSRTTGDGLMALFGAPQAHEDHALRACYAALALQEAMRAYAEETLRRHGVAIQARVGLNSGDVVVRVISDDLHMDYTALGQTVHLAARMEQAATPGGILLAADMLRLVEGYIDARSRGPMPVKGLDEPVEAFDLLGAGRARTRLEASVARGLTPFTGRHSELDAVRATMARAQAGHGQVVALVGEPGVGKSRLVREVLHVTVTEGWTVLEAGATSYGSTTPYLPVIDILKRYFRVEAGDDPATAREKVGSALLGPDRAMGSAATALLSLLGVSTEDPAWEALDPPQRRRRTLDAVRYLLLADSRRRPLLLVFEDVHWVDEQTQALLDGLVEGLATARIILLVTHRPEYRHGWGGKTYYTLVGVEPLPGESATILLDALLGEDPSLEPLKRLLFERTGGNPFFLEESVRTLFESGALVGERGAYRLVSDLPVVRMPATVQAVLAARIDRLASEDKRLLQVAAAIGGEVPLPLLRATVRRPDEAMQASLQHLQAAEFLYPTVALPEPALAFKHALTREVAYGSLLRGPHAALHGRVLDAMEALYGERLSEHVERLADHALRGEAWQAAAEYGRQAGRKAMLRSANREAVSHFERALLALARLPGERRILEQAIDVRLELRPALNAIGEGERASQLLREAEAMAEALHDERRHGRTLSLLTFTYFDQGEHRRACEVGERALAIGRSLSDPIIQGVAAHLLTFPYRALGDFRRAVAASEAAVDDLDGRHGRERYGVTGYPAVASRSLAAGCLAELGEFDRARTYGEEAVRLAKALGHTYTHGAVQLILSYLHLRQGCAEAAIPLLEECLDIFERWDLPHLVPEARACLASAYALSGRLADGVRLMEQAASRIESARMGTLTPSVSVLADAYLLIGRIGPARQLVEPALDAARRHAERGYQADLLRVLGEVAAWGEPPAADHAEALLREALALAEELGMRPLQARCHLGLGKLYRRIGRAEDARAHLEQAVEMLRAMGMRRWLPEDEAELASVDAEARA